MMKIAAMNNCFLFALPFEGHKRLKGHSGGSIGEHSIKVPCAGWVPGCGRSVARRGP